jgi:acyl-coenzyme A thioesterase PaaI-like protein
LASVKEGRIIGKAKLISNSIFKHIWDVEITDVSGKLISISRVTNSIKEINSNIEKD